MITQNLQEQEMIYGNESFIFGSHSLCCVCYKAYLPYVPTAFCDSYH